MDTVENGKRLGGRMLDEETDLHGDLTVDTRSSSSAYVVCGERVPKNKVTFIAQIIAIYIIIIVSAVNLSIDGGSRQELWIALLSSAVGYVLPSPTLKFRRPNQTDVTRDGTQ
jgi:hypothetical protein